MGGRLMDELLNTLPREARISLNQELVNLQCAHAQTIRQKYIDEIKNLAALEEEVERANAMLEAAKKRLEEAK